jgi:two-component system chemotaxis response regulator CheY
MARILIVEDAPFIVESFKEIINDQGWQVSGVAKTGFEAIDSYRKNKPDIVIMDILLPGLDGLAAIKKIREIDSKAKILVVSALAKKGLDKECIKAGAKAFIKKPFDTKTFVTTLKALIEAE